MKNLFTILILIAAMVSNGQSFWTVANGGFSVVTPNNCDYQIQNLSTNPCYFIASGTSSGVTYTDPGGTVHSTTISSGNLQGAGYCAAMSTSGLGGQDITPGYNWASVSVTYSIQVGNSPSTLQAAQSVSASSYGGITTFTVTDGPQPPTYTNYAFIIKNTLPYPATATWTFNGSTAKTELLQPNQSDTWTTPPIEVTPTAQSYTETSGLTDPLAAIQYTTNSDGGISPTFATGPTYSVTTSGSGGTGSVTGTTSPPSYGTPNTPTTGSGGGGGGGGGGTGTPIQANNTNAPTPVTQTPSTNSPLTFPTPTGLASESTLAAGFNANAIGQQNLLNGINILHNDLNAQTLFVTNVLGDIDRYTRSNNDAAWALDGSISNLNHSVTNLSISSPSNTISSSSNVWVQNWPTNTYPDYSNLLSEIETNTRPQTNSPGTNGSAYMWSLIPQTATNQAAAEAAATAAQGDYGVDSVLTSLSPNLPSSSPPAPNMTIIFMGQTYDLDPNHLVPNASTVSITGWRIILILAFLLSVGNMFWKLLQIRASTETGGVPDLEVNGSIGAFGFEGALGGNFIGVIVFLITPLIIIGLFTLAMGYLFSHLGVSISEAMNISGWTDGMGPIAYYLLASFFPVSFFFSLLITRITLIFALGKIVAIATAAARWIMGK